VLGDFPGFTPLGLCLGCTGIPAEGYWGPLVPKSLRASEPDCLRQSQHPGDTCLRTGAAAANDCLHGGLWGAVGVSIGGWQ